MVLAVAPEGEQCDELAQLLKQAGLHAKTAQTEGEILHLFHAEPPACIVMAYDTSDLRSILLLRACRGEALLYKAPVLLVLEPAALRQVKWRDIPADDYVLRPVNMAELVTRVELARACAARHVECNPLTGLPGNNAIAREAERRLTTRSHFSLAYLDIDYFKPYNDKYGFSRGDEVLRMTARIVSNAVQALNDADTYVGHIGGDDFVFMTPCDLMIRTAETIIASFDTLAPRHYDEDDRVGKGIKSINRQGNPQVFPLLTCTIAIVDTSYSNVLHLADISARSAELKQFAKVREGSNYVVERRR